MGLAERLDALRGGGPSARVPDRPLAERVARLAVARSGVAKETLGTAELAKRCGGEKVGDGVVLIEHQRSLPELALGQPDRQRWLYLDTETTGLAGGSGTRVFLLGLARLQSGRLHSRQYLLARIGGESALLAHAAGWLRPEERLVSYNGKSFDLPLLATRYRLAGLADPFAGRDHLDLLHRVRRAYAGRWQDCRLASAERRLLGIERHDDLPGSQAPEAWLQWLRTGRSTGDRRNSPPICWQLPVVTGVMASSIRPWRCCAGTATHWMATAGWSWPGLSDGSVATASYRWR